MAVAVTFQTSPVSMLRCLLVPAHSSDRITVPSSAQQCTSAMAHRALGCAPASPQLAPTAQLFSSKIASSPFDPLKQKPHKNTKKKSNRMTNAGSVSCKKKKSKLLQGPEDWSSHNSGIFLAIPDKPPLYMTVLLGQVKVRPTEMLSCHTCVQ